ncbi:MAG: metallophosphoesterase [Clostridia bacterium]|nr:metallophosphoesterase [Clostridia bacterium]
MKKVISVVLAVCMLFSLATMSFAGLKADAKLQFNSNGKFKILCLADVQDSYPMEPAVIQFIKEALDFAAPDLVVFVGDNVVGEDIRAIDEMIAPLDERDIPFTFVFGNHDDEGGMVKEDQLAAYQKYDECMAYDADPSLSGCATHNLPILSSDGSKVAFNVWCFDSGGSIHDEDGEWLGYDHVHADQIEWYEETREALAAENGGEVVPSLAFQHIIPQEPVEMIFYEGAIALGEATINFSDGTVYTVVPDITKYDGYIFEKSCPSYGNDGQWDAMVDGGDVIGLVVGHDHVNNFVADCGGIDLIQTPGCTYNSYYNNMFQGARVIELDESDLTTYETYNLTSNELAQRDDSQLGEMGGRNNYDFFYTVEKIFTMIYDLFVDFFKSFA